MAYFPPTGSVVAFQSDPTKLVGTVSVVGTLPVVLNNSSVISVAQGSVATVIIGGSIAASFTPPANQSVSGAVTAPAGSVMTIANPAGSVTAVSATQGTSPWVVNFQNSSILAFQLAGSVLATSATVNPAANQSVSGAVTTQAGSIMSVTNPAGSVTAVRFDTASVITVWKDSSVIALQLAGSVLATSATVNPAANQSVSGAITAPPGSVMSVTNPAGSVTTVIATNPAGSITSMTNPAGSVTTVRINDLYQEETVGGPSVRGIALVWQSSASTSVMSTVSPTNPLRVLGSVSGAVTFPAGSVATMVTPAGSITAVSATNPAGSITSVTFPAGSTMAVSATAPAGSIMATNQVAGSVMAVSATQPAGSLLAAIQVAGSVMAVSATQGTTPWTVSSVYGNISGSVVGFMGGTWKPSVINLITRNDTVASFLGADLVERPMMGDAIGRTIVKPFVSEDATIISYVGSIVSGSVQLIQASAVGKKSYITDFWLSNTGATTTLVTIQDGSTSLIGQFIAPTGGGFSSPGLNIPLKTANAQDLAFKVSPSTSVLYLALKGWQGQ